jgi:hypothetical protein
MRITVNGRGYNSIDEMPPDVRAEYQRAIGMLADEDGNGVPDILERGNVSVSSSGPGKEFTSSVITSQTFNVNGQEFSRWEDVPPEIRQLLGKRGGAAEQAPGLRLAAGIDRPGGLTIHVTWSMVLALLAAIGCTVLIAWLLLG